MSRSSARHWNANPIRHESPGCQRPDESVQRQLAHADLQKAHLAHAWIAGVNLTGADSPARICPTPKFTRDWTGGSARANLYKAFLWTRSDFSGVDFSTPTWPGLCHPEVKFVGANLSGANFRE